MNRFTKSPIQVCRGRQVPTDHVSYVEDTFRVAGMPSMNRFTKIPIQARRGLPTGIRRDTAPTGRYPYSQWATPLDFIVPDTPQP